MNANLLERWRERWLRTFDADKETEAV